MPKILDPFRFLLIALAGWMNQHQLQIIDYLREQNRVLREQIDGRRPKFGSPREFEKPAIGVDLRTLPFLERATHLRPMSEKKTAEQIGVYKLLRSCIPGFRQAH